MHCVCPCRSALVYDLDMFTDDCPDRLVFSFLRVLLDLGSNLVNRRPDDNDSRLSRILTKNEKAISFVDPYSIELKRKRKYQQSYTASAVGRQHCSSRDIPCSLLQGQICTLLFTMSMTSVSITYSNILRIQSHDIANSF